MEYLKLSRRTFIKGGLIGLGCTIFPTKLMKIKPFTDLKQFYVSIVLPLNYTELPKKKCYNQYLKPALFKLKSTHDKYKEKGYISYQTSDRFCSNSIKIEYIKFKGIYIKYITEIFNAETNETYETLIMYMGR